MLMFISGVGEFLPALIGGPVIVEPSSPAPVSVGSATKPSFSATFRFSSPWTSLVTRGQPCLQPPLRRRRCPCPPRIKKLLADLEDGSRSLHCFGFLAVAFFHTVNAVRSMNDSANAIFSQLLPCARLDPSQGILDALEFAEGEFSAKFLCNRSLQSRPPRTGPLAVQQSLDPFIPHSVTIREDRLPADTCDVHDLGDGMLLLANQPHHKESFARPIWLALCPCLLDLPYSFLFKIRKGSH